MVGLNRPFYTLLLSKRGPAAALTAIPLQVVHDVISAAAVPLAVTAHLLDDTKHENPLA
jgi:hypothetical protein